MSSKGTFRTMVTYLNVSKTTSCLWKKDGTYPHNVKRNVQFNLYGENINKINYFTPSALRYIDFISVLCKSIYHNKDDMF